MRRTILWRLAALAWVPLLCSTAWAQNVTGYGSIPEPFLFLLREPAVHDDLKLTAQQRAQLRQLNDRVDSPLLASRNRSPDESSPVVANLVKQSKAAVEQILTPAQRDRIDQIAIRIQGITIVSRPEIAKRLGLTGEQRTAIKGILSETRKEIADLKDERRAVAVRQQQQLRVLSHFTEPQQKSLRELVGPNFDLGKLSRTKFKAPEIHTTGNWINSKPLPLTRLRGKVVALHFWAFG